MRRRNGSGREQVWWRKGLVEVLQVPSERRRRCGSVDERSTVTVVHKPLFFFISRNHTLASSAPHFTPLTRYR